MGTWRAINELSLNDLGITVAGESADATDVELAFKYLIDMIDGWAIKGLMIPGFVRYTHEIDGEVEKITVGEADADLIAHPPVQINSLYYTPKDSPPYRLRRLNEPLVGKPDPDTTGTPTEYHYERNIPVSTLWFNGFFPGTEGDTVTIVGKGRLTEGEFQLDDETGLPEGYTRALRLNLTVELAAPFGKAVSRILVQEARDARSEIRKQNLQPMVAKQDPSFKTRSTNFLGRGTRLG